MAGDERDPGIDFMSLEPLDIWWMRVRDMYEPFETGMKSSSARVFDHEIPGGQYANLYVQVPRRPVPYLAGPSCA